MLRTPTLAACLSLVIASPAYGAAGCHLNAFANLPITMNSLRPTVATKINGKDAKFVLDSGAVFSMMSSATAAEYSLKKVPVGFDLSIQGIGGSASVELATIKEFTFLGVGLKNMEFLVGGSQTEGAGLLGQNILQNFDVEYDLASGVIRLFKTDGCDEAMLAYWVKPGQAYSSMHVDRIDPRNPHTVGRAYINGKEIKIAFDTGAFTSVLTTSAAARAGVTPQSAGVVESGYTGGVGRGHVKTYVAPFASFKIGDGEEIQNTKLRIADLDLRLVDMLLGADFFISHRIFVANKEHRIFLTYNGGPVFNLSKRANAPMTAETPEQSDSTAPAVNSASESVASDAGQIARHGAALAARQEYAPAITELTKAIALSPQEPEYYFQRANAYWKNAQADLALQDFDRVIALKRDFLPAYIPSAELRFAKQDMEGGLADLDAVDQLAPKPADLRFMLAELYQRLDHFLAAIAQYTWWIQYHGEDSRMVAALKGRCLSSALQNQDLRTAVSDCNTALHRADKKNPNYPQLWADRGLVHLRQGEYDRALGDFNDAIKAMPNNAAAFYGRGVAESRKGNKAASDSDLAQAAKLAPKLAERFQKFGIVP